ncbi:MAG: hypothetical protein Q8S13_07120 [Dehalococcoidia bacterium]|nr:hypothetical protein [Dehalococcoidia bacterium]
MWRAALRSEIFEVYGKSCACCGISEEVFLAVDHIDNSGAKHRREIGNGGTLYQWLRANGFPPGFQILCYNCNRAKYMLGTCPHQTAALV